MKFVPVKREVALHPKAQAIVDRLMDQLHIHRTILDDNDWMYIEISRQACIALGQTKAAESLEELLNLMSQDDSYHAEVIRD